MHYISLKTAEVCMSLCQRLRRNPITLHSVLNVLCFACSLPLMPQTRHLFQIWYKCVRWHSLGCVWHLHWELQELSTPLCQEHQTSCWNCACLQPASYTGQSLRSWHEHAHGHSAWIPGCCVALDLCELQKHKRCVLRKWNLYFAVTRPCLPRTYTVTLNALRTS